MTGVNWPAIVKDLTFLKFIQFKTSHQKLLEFIIGYSLVSVEHIYLSNHPTPHPNAVKKYISERIRFKISSKAQLSTFNIAR